MDKRTKVPYVDLFPARGRTRRRPARTYPPGLTLGLWAGLATGDKTFGGVEAVDGRSEQCFLVLADWYMTPGAPPGAIREALGVLIKNLRRRGNWQDVPKVFLRAAVEIGLATERETL